MGNSQSVVVALCILATALLYVSWRNNKTREDVRSLSQLVDASVSLEELQEQVIPAIKSLQTEAACLKRELQTLARKTAGESTSRSPEMQSAAPERADYSESEEVEVFPEDASSMYTESEYEESKAMLGTPTVPDINAIMGTLCKQAVCGFHAQRGGASSIGVPVARVVINAHPVPAENFHPHPLTLHIPKNGSQSCQDEPLEENDEV